MMVRLPLVSARLHLRDFCSDDWPAVYAYRSHPDETRFYLDKIRDEAQAQARTDYTLAMVLRATDRVIGACNLTITSQRFRSGEIGYLLHPMYWKDGYATEAAKRLLQFGFAELGLHRIIGQCDPRNTASARVLERLGMRYEGHLRGTMLIQDGWRDSLIYSLLEQEWPNLSEKDERPTT